jgi:hypothetical protein
MNKLFIFTAEHAESTEIIIVISVYRKELIAFSGRIAPGGDLAAKSS